MKFRIELSVLLIILSILCSSCNAARNAGENQNDKPANTVLLPTFEELYPYLIGDDEELAAKTRATMKANLHLYEEGLLEKAALLDPRQSIEPIMLIVEINSPKVEEIILGAMDSDDRDLLIAGIKAAGIRKIENSLDALMEFSRSDDSGIRGNAASGLAAFPDFKPGLARLRELAEDPVMGVRMAAYNGIGKSGGSDAARLLYDAILHESEVSSSEDGQFLMFTLKTTFRNVVDSDDCEWIVEGLIESNDDVRVTIIETLAQLKCSSGVDQLAAISTDLDETDVIRFKAGFALAFIGDPAGYKAADAIYFATDEGLLEVNETNIPAFSNIMIEFKAHLDELMLKTITD